MSKYELVKFDTAEALAAALAQEFFARILTFSTRREGRSPGGTCPLFSVALSGGRIAGEFFIAAARAAQGQKRILERVEFFWGDERAVPPGHPESNFRLAWTRLLAPSNIPPDRIHRIKGELEAQVAATEAENEIRRLLPANPNGLPLLDLVLLGMGEDGHVASLFPGEPESLRDNPAIFRPVTAPKPPPSRVTMGYGPLAAARELWVLVSGAGKAAALAQSLSAQGGTPLGKLLQLRNKTVIWTDVLGA